MKYFIFYIFLVISNLSYSYENNQLLLHNPAKKINFFDLETLDGKKVEVADKLIKKMSSDNQLSKQVLEYLEKSYKILGKNSDHTEVFKVLKD